MLGNKAAGVGLVAAHRVTHARQDLRCGVGPISVDGEFFYAETYAGLNANIAVNGVFGDNRGRGDILNDD